MRGEQVNKESVCVGFFELSLVAIALESELSSGKGLVRVVLESPAARGWMAGIAASHAVEILGAGGR